MGKVYHKEDEYRKYTKCVNQEIEILQIKKNAFDKKRRITCSDADSSSPLEAFLLDDEARSDERAGNHRQSQAASIILRGKHLLRIKPWKINRSVEISTFFR